MVTAPRPRGIGGSGLELDHVLPLQLDLLRVLDHDDPLVLRHIRRERVEHRRLAAARAPRDDHVELRDDERLQRFGGLRRQGAKVDQPVDRQRLLEEATNRDIGPLGSRRGQDRLQAGAVGETALEDGTLLVNVLPGELRGVSQHRDQGLPAVEAHPGELELAPPLDVHLMRTVDHDLADARVVEKGADRRKELEQRFFEDFAGDHWTVLRRDARASSACGPLGSRLRYWRKW